MKKTVTQCQLERVKNSIDREKQLKEIVSDLRNFQRAQSGADVVH